LRWRGVGRKTESHLLARGEGRANGLSFPCAGGREGLGKPSNLANEKLRRDVGGHCPGRAAGAGLAGRWENFPQFGAGKEELRGGDFFAGERVDWESAF